MSAKPLEREFILDKAIVLAQKTSWASFSFSQLADSIDCSLSDIGHHFRSKDDMVEAFFDRADQAVWALNADQAYRQLSDDDKLFQCIMCWLESLTPYKPLVKDMLAYKFEPGHFHLQAHGITRISRTVQWFLEVAERKHSGLKQIADEFAVTSTYLTTFSCYLFDNSHQHAKTRALLKQLIQNIDKSHNFFAFGNPAYLNTSNKQG